jgi:hypothetical protein
MNEAERDRPAPPRPDPVEPAQDRSAIIRTLLWITGGANTVLVGLIAAGYGGQFLLVVLFLVDLGLLLVWSAIGHRWMLQLGERIGERIAERRSRS